MAEIRLEKDKWDFDESRRLGPAGGFGEVFAGQGTVGPVAVKRLNLTAVQAAHREMAIGRSLADRSLRHVVPILDYGQDSETDRYFLVMPVCDQSLQQRMSIGFDFESAKEILLDVSEGLKEVGDLVHRDLKPGNILFHEDVWKIADFGIAKFVEDSTSLETLRGSLTPAYGAPEQWRGERPSKATDVYALACIAHALFNGAPPFVGDASDVRDGHLHKQPPPLKAPMALSAVVSQMLRKAPDSRPTLDRFVSVLQSAEEVVRPGPKAALAAAAEKIARERSAAEAVEAERRSQEERWNALGREAIGEIRQITERLLAEIKTASSDVAQRRGGLDWGAARLSFSDPRTGNFVHAKDRPTHTDWEVVAWLVTSLICEHGVVGWGGSNRYSYGSTLFFGRSKGHQEFRWRELSFFAMSGNFDASPFGLHMDSQDAQVALSRAMGMVSVALAPVPIDAENEVDFQNRWLSLVARAAAGELSHPNQMPPPASFYG